MRFWEQKGLDDFPCRLLRMFVERFWFSRIIRKFAR